MLTAVVFLTVTSTAAPDVFWSSVTSGGVYCSAEMGDLDGDGVNDVCCGVNFWDSEPTLWAVSGASGDTVWTSDSHKGIYQNEGFIAVPDMNGDGKSDLLLATPGGYDPPGRSLILVSGADGSTVWQWAACQVMPSYTGWGYSSVLLDDMNADGIPECAGGFGTSGSSGTGLIACIDGSSGDSLWTVWTADAVEDLQEYSDVDQDGYGDILAAIGGNSYTAESARLVSGADGSVLWQRNPGGDCMSIGLLERPDTFPLAVFCTFAGTVACYDGGGDLQWDYSGSGFYLDVRGGPDVNGDGVGDAALAADDGGAVCLSGADGQVLWTVPTGSSTWSVAWVDPVYLQGVPVPCVAAGSVNGRKVVLINGLSGETVWEMDFTERVYNVSAVNLDLPSPVVIAGLQDQQPLPDHAWALASSTETGIEQTDPVSPLLITNPSSGSISFTSCIDRMIVMKVFDISGRLVHAETVPPDHVQGTTPDLVPGVYLVRISVDESEHVFRVTVL